ncbi:hypothetical protein JTB14_004354 [Gonioctena quinquepunctata]|nr:hypothetical protein JTB14_004354 [Gonioctena quinquepunctata]
MAPKGSMTTELFIEFVRHLTRYKGPDAILLVFDGAACHLDYDIVEAADEHNIKLFCLPSNTTHELQPLDKSMYRLFESHWDQELFRFWDHHPDRVLTKTRFNEVFSKVWYKCMTLENIVNGFKATGLYPINPEIIPEHAFALSIPTERPAPAEQDQDIAALGSTNLNDSLNAIDDGFSAEDLIPLIQLSSQQHIIENKTVELEELAPEQQSGDGDVNKSFTQLLPTPTMKLKPKSNRRKALNYKAQAVTNDLFNPQLSTTRLQQSKRGKRVKVPRNLKVGSAMCVRLKLS